MSFCAHPRAKSCRPPQCSLASLARVPKVTPCKKILDPLLLLLDQNTSRSKKQFFFLQVCNSWTHFSLHGPSAIISIPVTLKAVHLLRSLSKAIHRRSFVHHSTDDFEWPATSSTCAIDFTLGPELSKFCTWWRKIKRGLFSGGPACKQGC